ncbi:MAG: glycosyltransferase family 39 protein [Chloroflexota bacterium]
MTASNRARATATLVALVVLLAGGLAVRLALLDVEGHYGDAVVMGRWADSMATYGPGGFYGPDASIYPALLYLFWPIGVFLDGADQARAIKGLSIPFDLVIGVVVYVAARRLVGPTRALVAPAIYLFNPAVLLAGPVWGQIDAAGTLAYLFALLALAAGRYWGAGAFTAIAMLIKPQFGLVILPVATVAVIAWRARRDATVVGATVLGGLLTYLILTLPLGLDPISYVGRVIGAGSFKELASANAANIWGLTVGYDQPDGALLYVGAVLLLAGLVASLLPLRHRQDLPTILAVGVFVAFAFYFLPTRVHERYLFPAMAVLAPLAAANWRVFAAYLLLTAGFAASLLYALVDTSPFSMSPSLDALVTAPVLRIWISLTMIGSAATLVLLLLRPPPRTTPPA